MHALLIGATGMLAKAAGHVAQSPALSATRITLVARHASRFAFADPALDAKLNPVDADWAEECAFLEAIDQAAAAHGPFGLALLWLHPKAPALRAQLADRIAAPPRRYIEVLGSASSRPGSLAGQQLAVFGARGDVAYQQVILGFVLEGAGARWLTHDEISAAAIQALGTATPRIIAGTLEPWDKRP